MTEKNPTATDQDAPTSSPPADKAPPKQSVVELYRSLGFRELPLSGKGYILPAAPKRVPRP
jgi:hypothetical protein